MPCACCDVVKKCWFGSSLCYVPLRDKHQQTRNPTSIPQELNSYISLILKVVVYCTILEIVEYL